MASTSQSTAILCQAILALAFLLVVCSARNTIDKSYDAAMTPSNDPYPSKPSPLKPSPSKPFPSIGSKCNKAYSVKESETCYAVRKMFKLNEKNFFSINPNVECYHLFDGQWLCIKAGRSAN